MSSRWIAIVALAGCAGGTFHVEPQLAAGAKDTVTGPRYEPRACDRVAAQTGIEQFVDGTTIHAGDVTLIAASARVVDDIQDQVSAHVFNDLAHLQATVSGSAHGDTFSETSLKDPSHSPDALVTAIIAILHVAKRVTENASLTFVAGVHDREVVGTCRSVNRATTMGVFNPPDFTVTCGLVSQDGKARELHLEGSGSWANYRFAGTLSGGARPWTIASQNVSVMGRWRHSRVRDP